jgi:hypothetical protein
MKGKNLNVLAFFYYLLEPCIDLFGGRGGKGGGGGCDFSPKKSLNLQQIFQSFALQNSLLHTHITSSCDELQLQAVWILQ